MFNLPPLLPFDGGHVVIAIYERIQEWRKHRRPRYYADVNRLMPVVYAVIFLLVLLGVSCIYLDIVNPIEGERWSSSATDRYGASPDPPDRPRAPAQPGRRGWRRADLACSR